MIEMNKRYTSNGKPVRLLCVDGPDPRYPVVGVREGFASIEEWTIDGKYVADDRDSTFSLVEVKEKQVRYVNIYINKGATDKYRTPGENAYLYNNRHEADINAHHNRFACIEIDFEEGEGL